jgi:hypothetical protein
MILLYREKKISQLIKDQDASLTFVKPKKSSSSVWSYFSYVYVHNHKKDFVCCDKCKDVLQHKSMDGTSNMIKHSKLCQSANKNVQNTSISIKEYLRPKNSQPIPRMLKEKITAATVEFIALDNRAFELVHGDGFMNLIRTIFNAGQILPKSNSCKCFGFSSKSNNSK